MSYDLVIRGGTVIDGTGAPSYRGHVAIKGGKIAAVGKVAADGARKLDAEGLVVSPGFFDMHTHYDVQLMWDPLATPSCWHGVTTALTGNCGYTIAPGRAEDSDYLMKLFGRVEGIPPEVIKRGVSWDWSTFGEWVALLRNKGLGINVAAQVGHSALRYYVMGKASYERAATAEEITRMQELLQEGIAVGAVGFSTSQSATQVGSYGEPVPSRMSTPEELLALCQVVADRGAGILCMNPNPGAGYISPQFQEFLIGLGRATGLPMLWNSLMHRRDRPEAWREMLSFMGRAASQGAAVYAMARCQPLEMRFQLRDTHMLDRSPAWKEIMHEPYEEKVRLMAQSQVRDRLKADWDRPPVSGPGGIWSDTVKVEQAELPKNKELGGQRIADLAAAAKRHPVDYLLDLALAEQLQTHFTYTAMNNDPKAIEEIIKSPYSLPGVSDAGAHLDHEIGVDFTSVFLRRWVGERGIMSLEEGVRRLTSLPASLLGLSDRGTLVEGMAADIVVFDPATIRALPVETLPDLPGGSERIIQRAEGIQAVIVNGEVLIEDNRHSGAMPGKVVAPAGKAR